MVTGQIAIVNCPNADDPNNFQVDTPYRFVVEVVSWKLAF